MVALFKKDKEIKSISSEDKQKLAEASRNLGYEVGYHRHSEIGWVQEQLSRLDNFSSQYGLKDFSREQYNLGKEQGSKDKDRDTKSGLSRLTPEKEDERRVEISTEPSRPVSSASRVGSGYRHSSEIFGNSQAPTERPTLVSLPETVEMPKAVEMPKVLEGSRHLLPKK